MKDNILHQVRRLSLKDEVDKDRMSDWLKVFEVLHHFKLVKHQDIYKCE